MFGWLGATAFGGPAAHIALMRSELVDRRMWVDETTFLDLVGVTALLPGPNSTELAIELGRRRAGAAVAAIVAMRRRRSQTCTTDQPPVPVELTNRPS